MSSLDIPDQYADYADAIKATMKKTLKLKLSPNPQLKKWQSKVGGTPYLPLTEPFPLSSTGEALLFLAQVNFSEIPHIDNLPNEGIVQFYIDGNDELMGLENGEFKVLYFKDVIEDDSKLHGVSKNYTFPIGPFEKDFVCAMNFSLENQYMSTSDYRFNETIDFGENWESYDEYSALYPANGHRIGGYPYFTQTDPRTCDEDLKDYELLFQLDSDENILWGDMGVGAFFIKSEDLKNLNFSDCLYNWDCS